MSDVINVLSHQENSNGKESVTLITCVSGGWPLLPMSRYCSPSWACGQGPPFPAMFPLAFGFIWNAPPVHGAAAVPDSVPSGVEGVSKLPFMIGAAVALLVRAATAIRVWIFMVLFFGV